MSSGDKHDIECDDIDSEGGRKSVSCVRLCIFIGTYVHVVRGHYSISFVAEFCSTYDVHRVNISESERSSTGYLSSSDMDGEDV